MLAGARRNEEEAARVVRYVRPTPRVVLIGLMAVLGVLLVIDQIGRASGLGSAVILSFDGEITVPTWWASTQLLLLAGVMLVGARRQWLVGRIAAARAMILGCCVAVYMSIDETAGIHEMITRTFKDKQGVPSFQGNHGVWILVYGVAATVVLAVALPGIWSLLQTDRTNALWFALGAVMLVVGGVGIEVIGYAVGTYTEVIVEETFEFSGVAVMIWAVYRMLQDWDVSFAVSGTTSVGGKGSGRT